MSWFRRTPPPNPEVLREGARWLRALPEVNRTLYAIRIALRAYLLSDKGYDAADVERAIDWLLQ